MCFQPHGSSDGITGFQDDASRRNLHGSIGISWLSKNIGFLLKNQIKEWKR
jgi:hypothetical protein